MLHRLLVLLLASAALASCAQTTPPRPVSAASAPETESARLASELRALIGPAACSADAQCRTVAVGAKACGGPAGYLAWSIEGTDAARVTDLAARQSQAQRREVQTHGLRSNCAVVTDPGAVCLASRCQLATAPSAR